MSTDEYCRDDGPSDGPTNMARDLDLLRSLGSRGFAGRVYGWDGPWVTLGRFQRPERVFAPGSTVPHVVRPTGGKAVLHGHDLTIGLAASLLAIGADSRQISKVYRKVCQPLVRALNRYGIAASLAEETLFVRSAGSVGDCFAHVSPNDIVDPQTGRKVCGCALKVGEDAVLVQASVPVAPPLVDPRDVFLQPALVQGTGEMDRARLAGFLGEELEDLARCSVQL